MKRNILFKEDSWGFNNLMKILEPRNIKLCLSYKWMK